jgi:circadian clock protein KaiB
VSGQASAGAAIDRSTTSIDGQYALILFVAGASGLSVQAISDVRRLCATYLTGNYSLEVVDVHRDSTRMLSHHVLAAPTLIKCSPPPTRRLVGDLSDARHVLAALDIDPIGVLP